MTKMIIFGWALFVGIVMYSCDHDQKSLGASIASFFDDGDGGGGGVYYRGSSGGGGYHK